ncbi:MAG: universal stress protein [Mycobacterium sp.]
MVVGIDGSKAAVHAAIWAIGEAIRRDAPLRLVHAIEAPAATLDRELADAHHVLDTAWTAVGDTGKPVKVESVTAMNTHPEAALRLVPCSPGANVR